MLIGELSSRSGLTRDTIRFYEKQGLISIRRKDRRENNYKEYPEEILERLLAIKRLKGFGFTLNETVAFLDLIEMNTASCENVAFKMNEKIQMIDEKIKALQDMKDHILKGMNNCSGPEDNSDNCPLIVS